MDYWTLSESGNLPSLKDLKINGETVDGFMPDNTYYEYFSDDENLRIDAFADDAYDVSIKHNQGKSYYQITVSEKKAKKNSSMYLKELLTFWNTNYSKVKMGMHSQSTPKQGLLPMHIHLLTKLVTCFPVPINSWNLLKCYWILFNIPILPKQP